MPVNCSRVDPAIRAAHAEQLQNLLCHPDVARLHGHREREAAEASVTEICTMLDQQQSLVDKVGTI
jgi:hypothetical protein